MDFGEGVGESSSPPRSVGSSGGGGGGAYDIRNEVYNRLLDSGNEEVIRNPELLREQLEAHFIRLPSSYGLDINMDRVEDVLLHQKLLTQAKDPDKRPAYHVRFLENFWTRVDETEDQDILKFSSMSKPHFNVNDAEGILHSDRRHRTSVNDFEACSKLEDLNLDVRKKFNGTRVGSPEENINRREVVSCISIHEVIFSTIDKPKLLSQLSALLSDIGLNIREAHVFSTTDGYSLDVFVVDGWPVEDPKGMLEELEKAIARSEGSWSGSSHSQSSVEKAISAQAKFEDWEIDRRLLKIGKKIASGSCGDLYHGVYLGLDVAVKVLRSEHLNDSLEDEFAQEVAILRQVQHKNVVRFIGACSKPPLLCIVTEYMPGGSLYDYLHRNHNTLKLSQLLRFAIDVCKGMEYLHQNNIIHRDLKTANLLMDVDKVVKVADFGVARFQSKGGVMTAETGTYRWMAPEVINHQPYDQKADVFSFAIVLWELATAKVPYDTMTPLQAALGVRQGLRPELPTDSHPKLVELMQRSWEAAPSERPSFSDIRPQLEELLKDVNVEEEDATELEAPNGS
ncbi:PREDICTED: serine/threonine-protein kinase STY46-like isoform X2 [Ipomoea nil]|uniref:serine/threonine-protein kinase STY46-like isoform X2 n=1 Tax=Ipomoea nil TaxID=35883 RepID=UPI00090100AD|nr:PREDICTED: serine/threonine-protein kinase STY46-like isoform X2 [Ipomoea nil]